MFYVLITYSFIYGKIVSRFTSPFERLDWIYFSVFKAQKINSLSNFYYNKIKSFLRYLKCLSALNELCSKKYKHRYQCIVYYCIVTDVNCTGETFSIAHTLKLFIIVCYSVNKNENDVLQNRKRQPSMLDEMMFYQVKW